MTEHEGGNRVSVVKSESDTEPRGEIKGLIDGFWSEGIGTGIGFILASAAAGYLIGIHTVIRNSELTWWVVATVPAFQIADAVVVLAFGTLLAGVGIGYHHRMSEEGHEE